MWSGCLVDALEEVSPGHGYSRETFRPHLAHGFPWHEHETAHPELCDSDAWWAHVGALLTTAYTTAGVDDASAAAAAVRVRAVYADHTRAWQLFDDVLPTLATLNDDGWRHAILSNHVPELSTLVAGLGLDTLVEAVVNSAVIGYEKPHPEAFACARLAVGDPDEVWMVGDNPIADVGGAEAVGIPAILVRRDGAPGLEAVVSRLAARAP
jgi:putative hydrolase of the HAD superfamily